MKKKTVLAFEEGCRSNDIEIPSTLARMLTSRKQRAIDARDDTHKGTHKYYLW